MADVIVGRFALIDLIAKGGSGSVWRAWDAKAQRLCAAKVLRQRDSADLMRFVREKGVAFDHPHLLAPYGWGAEDEHVVIAMPLVSGGTLESIVRSHGPVAEPTAVVILDQLLDGLSLVHAQGWIHRDVKPANLMFEATGRRRPHTRLADFGIAVHETDVRFTHVGMINGTPGYMAPELFDLAEPEPSHDIYAAGVVALMALNGPLALHDGPFRPAELDGYLRGASPKLAAVLRRMVAPRSADRFQDAASVRAALPRVPASFPLTFADGSDFRADDTLDPLPPDAPGAVRSPSMPAPGTPGPAEAARRGELPGRSGGPARSAPLAGGAMASAGQPPRADHAGFAAQPARSGQPAPGSGRPASFAPASRGGQAGMVEPARPQQSVPAGAPARAAAPAAVMPRSAPSPGGFPSPSPQTGPRSTGGPSGQRGASTGGGIGRAIGGVLPRNSRRRTIVAAVIGLVVAVLAGIALAAILLFVFSDRGTPSADPTSSAPESTGPAIAQVAEGQACTEAELGVVATLPDGSYISCTRQDDGSYAYA